MKNIKPMRLFKKKRQSKQAEVKKEILNAPKKKIFYLKPAEEFIEVFEVNPLNKKAIK
jgi:hypothetical protein